MSERRVPWQTVGNIVVIMLIFWYVVLLFMVLNRERPIGTAAFWSEIARGCQRLALVIGHAGLAAEKHYWTAIERSRL